MSAIDKKLEMMIAENCKKYTHNKYRFFSQSTLLLSQECDTCVAEEKFKEYAVKDIISGYGDIKNKKILEVGCGTGGLSVKDIRVIYNGYDPLLFKYTESGIKKRLNADYLLMYAGRPVPLKGIQYLFKATKELNKNFDNLKVLLVGVDRPDSKVFCAWLKSIATRYDLNNVIFSKGVLHIELPKYYSAADCFVLPSTTEGFPIVILEALACSCPVVATEVGGIPEMIDRKSGLLCKPRSASDLVDKISMVLKKEVRLDFTSLTKNFTWERSAEEISDYYTEVLGGGNRK